MYYTQAVSSTNFSAATSADIQQVQQRCCYIQKMGNLQSENWDNDTSHRYGKIFLFI